MTGSDIPLQRLHNQRIAGNPFKKPADVVSWLGAVQAQDYAPAKWALGLRLQKATDSTIEQAFTDGAILRTHLMRPTWHFVTPADIRWMLALTAPRVHALNAYYYRGLELDPTRFTRIHEVLVKALQDGEQLTREDLRGALEQAGIATQSALRMSYILMHAELDGLICSGPRRGKQFTYMLLDERVPQARRLEREEALAELVRRYFVSHGPATLKDFAWWSGLRIADARSGLEMVKHQLAQEVIGNQTYWASTATPPTKDASQAAYLLPNYDEYTISYRDHSAVFDASHLGDLVFSHMIVLQGQVVGTWKRSLKKNSVIIETNTFAPLAPAESQAVAVAAQQYADFLGLPAVLA